ncbi:MAG: protein translocase subunit SecD [Candidatus Nomurabacteria bacterium]|nr:MAG: protein translocase subunit SecD [Candidatus Nomurabacteria bacterium]
MKKHIIISLLVLVLSGFLGFLAFSGSRDYTFGLDLKGGSHLLYQADTSSIEGNQDIDDQLSVLRDLLEKRINVLGVKEPTVHVTKGINDENRIAIDLPGVTDIDEAIKAIGETPLLEFRLEKEGAFENLNVEDVDLENIDWDDYYERTELTGRYLKRSNLLFDSNNLNGYIVGLQFDSEGSELFYEITKDNIGKTLAIFLDGDIVSSPVIRDAISGGQAEISGNFTGEEAKELVSRLNAGALPIPIELVSTETIGPSLGSDAVDQGLFSGLLGILAITLFFVFYYRLPGAVASISLIIYTAIMMFIFKYMPVTLSAAGIAGFIISIGLAVDANVLIFERTKEELKKGSNPKDALEEGFKRAWTSIRDSNVSTIISTAILFWFGTSVIKGFALTFGIGVLVSMLTAITITRHFLLSFAMSEKLGSRFLKFSHKKN